MAPIDEALEDLRSSDHPNISATAKKYGVLRATLSYRFSGKTVSMERFRASQTLLNAHQERKLIQTIERLCQICLPPTANVVSNMASELAGRQVGPNWLSRFVHRHKDELDSRYLATLDLARHKAESRQMTERYFDTIEQKIEEYSITAENIYNMDEKGFMIGQLQKRRRIFSKATYEDKELSKAGQDGSREWITVLATICADGSVLSPALIYKAKSGNVQDSWLEAFNPLEQQCYFASTTNGWTSDEYGLAWLNKLFDRETRDKAKRSWRLLLLDGHASHVNITFLERCLELRILLAIYPPHSTHKLQPLDVSCFRPLAQNYNTILNRHIHNTAGICAIRKADFFKIFYEAWHKSFKKDIISSAWRKTGLFPWDPRAVLNTLKKAAPGPDAPHATSKRTSLSFLDNQQSPRKRRKLRREVDQISSKTDAKSSKIIDGVYDLYLNAEAKLGALKRDFDQIKEALTTERSKKKRQKTAFEQMRSDDGVGHTFISPNKVRRIRELNVIKQQEKEQLQADKQVLKEAAAQRRATKAVEIQTRRDARAVAAARRAEEALQRKAAREAQRADKQAAKKLKLAENALNNSSLMSPKIKPPARRSAAKPTKPKAPDPLKWAFSRRGRIVKRPKRLGD